VPGDGQLITGITGDALMCFALLYDPVRRHQFLTPHAPRHTSISHIKFPPRISNSVNAPARSIQRPVLRGHTPTGHSRSCARVLHELNLLRAAVTCVTTTPSRSGSAARWHPSSRVTGAGLARCSLDLNDVVPVVVSLLRDRRPGTFIQ
jgi:hypothetical protein